MTVLGMDMVRGLSGFDESEMFCKPGDSDLNNFCCMLRTLVAILKRGRGGGKERVVFKGVHQVHLFTQFFFTLPLHPFTSAPFHWEDDVAGL